MAKTTYLPELRETTERELKELRRQLADAEPGGQARGGRGERPLPPADQVAQQLGERIAQLERIQAWLTKDHELMRLVDSVIRQEVQRSERLQRFWSFVLTILSLIAGWLLSLVQDPLTLLHHLGLR
jgi:hypothetical protein